jgi:hypothetical protein
LVELGTKSEMGERGGKKIDILVESLSKLEGEERGREVFDEKIELGSESEVGEGWG